jgi:hypothetical protein
MQQTDPNTDRLLNALQNGSFFERRKAAEELAAVSATSQRIVDALINSLSNDPDPAVKDAAANAIQQPVHAAFVQADPILSKNVADAIQRKHLVAIQMATQAQEDQRKSNGLRSLGIYMLIFGVGSFILPLLGLQFRLLQLIPRNTLPICSVGLIIGGLALILFSQK